MDLHTFTFLSYVLRTITFVAVPSNFLRHLIVSRLIKKFYQYPRSVRPKIVKSNVTSSHKLMLSPRFASFKFHIILPRH
jgi:hypothetical protein